MKKVFARGFTLVELLIVIALLGVIATIVIAAINPIEQANRARDAGYKANASQLVSAIERYFTSHNDYPWVVLEAYDNNDVAYPFANGAEVNVGVCGDTSCTTDGELITAVELKTEFRQRDFIKKRAVVADTIYVGKAQGASASTYACYVPSSKSVRDTACKDSKVYTMGASGTRVSQACTSTSTWPATPTTGTAWVVCVPD